MPQQASVNSPRDGDEIYFCSMGMFIIDDIEFEAPKPPVKDILGGAGSYSALGARIFSPPPLSKSVGWIVDCGSDFPAELRRTIDAWNTSCLYRETPERLTTRGWNGYGANEYRAFKYLTSKIRLDENALTPQLLLSKCFHLICSPERCVSMIDGILGRRRGYDNEVKHPIFVWEPVPDLCTPEELENCMKALQRVDYVSPNHEELAGFYGAQGNTDDGVDRPLIEKCSRDWLDSRARDSKLKAIIVRAGKEGCYVANDTRNSWIPAYHQDGKRVIDPTGGGNAFLGGLAIELARGSSVTDAAIYGSVAASFAIEQVGVPVLSSGSSGKEEWNGESAANRVEELRRRWQQLS